MPRTDAHRRRRREPRRVDGDRRDHVPLAGIDAHLDPIPLEARDQPERSPGRVPCLVGAHPQHGPCAGVLDRHDRAGAFSDLPGLPPARQEQAVREPRIGLAGEDELLDLGAAREHVDASLAGRIPDDAARLEDRPVRAVHLPRHADPRARLEAREPHRLGRGTRQLDLGGGRRPPSTPLRRRSPLPQREPRRRTPRRRRLPDERLRFLEDRPRPLLRRRVRAESARTSKPSTHTLEDARTHRMEARLYLSRDHPVRLPRPWHLSDASGPSRRRDRHDRRVRVPVHRAGRGLCRRTSCSRCASTTSARGGRSRSR